MTGHVTGRTVLALAPPAPGLAAPLVLGGLVERAFEILPITAGTAQIGLAALLIGSVLYYRKALGAAATLQSGLAKLVFAAVVIGVLMILGIIPRIAVGEAVAYLNAVRRFFTDLFASVT